MRAGIGVIASAHVDAGGGGGVVLVNDPCDNFTATPWTVNGTPTVTASGFTGNGFQIGSGSTSRIEYAIPAPSQTNMLTVGCRIKLGTLSNTQRIFSFRTDTGATECDWLIVNTSGALSMTSAAVGQLGITATGVIAVATWYYLEVAILLSTVALGAIGSVTVRKDGSPILTLTAKNTHNTGQTKNVWDQFRFVSAGSITNWFLDDIYIRNDLTFGP